MVWESVLPEVYLFRDSCNVYAIECPNGIVIVNAGTGNWLASVDGLPAKVVALACTHYFRDHAAGATAAAEIGIEVFVPEYEREIFADPNRHFAQRESYIVYDNLWDRFSPILPTNVSGELRDYATVDFAGRSFTVIPLPGVTCGQIGLLATLSDGQTVIFCAESIHSPGRIARIAPLQYNYNDLSGAINVHESARRLREIGADALLPSLGEPMLANTDDALAELQTNLRALIAVRPPLAKRLATLAAEDLEQVTEHVWWDRKSEANTVYIVSDSGKVMAIDYGYDLGTMFPNYPKKDRRRALLHGLDALKRTFGADQIDVVLVSHFHDDHVCGIPVLQRLHGTECWIPDNFADLLAHPEAHTFPCNWPVPISVTRRLSLDEPFEWEGIRFHLGEMSGHTRFSALIGFEVDGKRFAHTGDQYFFENGVESFENNLRSQNHVYRNGALLDGYAQSGRWMLDWRPDIVIQGHQPPMITDEHFFRHIAEWSIDYAELAKAIMPLADHDIHLNLDSWGGWIWPYRISHSTLTPFEVTVVVRNPLPSESELQVRLVGPTGWQSETKNLRVSARSESTTTLQMTPSYSAKNQPIALELVADGRPFGQVAEAIVSVMI